MQDLYLHDLSRRAPIVPRIGAWPPIRYYFVDFGISVKFPADLEPKRTVGIIGLDRDAPELSNTRPYDPFRVDIFILGNVFKKDIYAVRSAARLKQTSN